ncbi:hypothetical protein [Streptomyces mirabilis]
MSPAELGRMTATDKATVIWDIPTGKVLSGDGIRYPSYGDRATRRP